MGNQTVKDFNDYDWQDKTEIVGETNNNDRREMVTGKSKHKTLMPETKLLRNKRKAKVNSLSNKSLKISSSCYEFQRIRTRFGDSTPVVLALLTDSSYRIRLGNKPVRSHCCSQINISLPCDHECRRLMSNSYTTCCRKCKKSYNKRKKQKRC